jgi:type IV pilus assembly protein PilM
MSHTICGIDLGAFSIKFVMLEVGFRQTQLRGLIETAVPLSDAPLLERQGQAIREGLSRVSGEATPYLALPGDLLSIRLLDLPFTDPRKIDQVLGYELEGQIVHPLEDVVFDHLVVRAGDEGSTVLAVAAKRDDIAYYLASLEGQGTEPRALYAAPVVYRALPLASSLVAPPRAIEPESEPEPGGAPTGGGCQVILDIGHLRTNLCFVSEGQGMYARTIKRGGFQLTTAIAQAFDVSYERAEQAKRGDAYLASAAHPAGTPVAVKLDGVLREALAPLVREIRQTLASFRATSKVVVDTLLITGGSGRLRGLSTFLEGELGMPARFLAVRGAVEMRPRGGAPDGAGSVVEADESSSYALATAIALAASRGSKEIDLRRGPFVFRASFSMLRQKAVHLGLLLAGVILALGLDVGAALTNLGSERKDLAQQLKTATQELLGQPHDDAKAVTQLLRKGFKEELAPLPKATAFDLLDQISRRVPSADKVKLDVMELDIRPKKTFIKGTVDSAAAVDEIGGKLKEIDCYEEVTKGAITEVSGGGKQFTMNITSKCP